MHLCTAVGAEQHANNLSAQLAPSQQQAATQAAPPHAQQGTLVAEAGGLLQAAAGPGPAAVSLAQQGSGLRQVASPAEQLQRAGERQLHQAALRLCTWVCEPPGAAPRNPPPSQPPAPAARLGAAVTAVLLAAWAPVSDPARATVSAPPSAQGSPPRPLPAAPPSTPAPYQPQPPPLPPSTAVMQLLVGLKQGLVGRGALPGATQVDQMLLAAAVAVLTGPSPPSSAASEPYPAPGQPPAPVPQLAKRFPNATVVVRVLLDAAVHGMVALADVVGGVLGSARVKGQPGLHALCTALLLGPPSLALAHPGLGGEVQGSHHADSVCSVLVQLMQGGLGVGAVLPHVLPHLLRSAAYQSCATSSRAKGQVGATSGLGAGQGQGSPGGAEQVAKHTEATPFGKALPGSALGSETVHGGGCCMSVSCLLSSHAPMRRCLLRHPELLHAQLAGDTLALAVAAVGAAQIAGELLAWGQRLHVSVNGGAQITLEPRGLLRAQGSHGRGSEHSHEAHHSWEFN